MLNPDHFSPLILASGSPRRQELLANLGLSFQVIVPDVDEAALSIGITDPNVLVQTLAKAKAEATEQLHPQQWVIGADTVVVLTSQNQSSILGKPTDEADALAMLQQLQGRSHQVMTGIAVVHGKKTITAVATTTVWMDAASEADLKTYIASGEPMDKAGAYAIQGLGSHFIEKIDGCYFNVVGLPLNLLAKTLQSMTYSKVNTF